jgi:hypothetical protein
MFLCVLTLLISIILCTYLNNMQQPFRDRQDIHFVQKKLFNTWKGKRFYLNNEIANKLSSTKGPPMVQ